MTHSRPVLMAPQELRALERVHSLVRHLEDDQNGLALSTSLELALDDLERLIERGRAELGPRRVYPTLFARTEGIR